MVFALPSGAEDVDLRYRRIVAEEVAHRLGQVVVVLFRFPVDQRRVTTLERLGERVHVPDDGIRQAVEMPLIGPDGPVAADDRPGRFQQVERVRFLREKPVAEDRGRHASTGLVFSTSSRELPSVQR